MNRYVLGFVILLLITFEPAMAQQGTINVTVQGLENTKGNLCITLCDNKENFTTNQENAIIKKIIPIKDKKVTFSLSNVIYGVYAIAVIHDQNKNNKMDYHILGFPTEGYGVSNNVRNKFGPPSFDKSKFILNSENRNIIIDIHYFLR